MGCTDRAVSAVLTYGLSDGWLQRTPLRVEQDRAFLKVGFRSTAFPIYDGGAAERQPVGRVLSKPISIIALLSLGLDTPIRALVYWNGESDASWCRMVVQHH